MSTPFIQKCFWKVANPVLATYYQITGKGTGVLPHRKDHRDLHYIVGGIFSTKGKYENLSLDTGIRFNQYPDNICVFASRVQGFSMQECIRFSVRWDVKVARKNGWISGNGWSSLRAENNIGHDIGRLPYDLMPDEINSMSWEEYSSWTPEDDKLLEIASHYKSPDKAPNYYFITTKSQAIDALENGLALFTAGKWYSHENRPYPPMFKLDPSGDYLGGHAYTVTGYRNYGDDFENIQTFGLSYGDSGKAWIDNLFGPEQYAMYVEKKLPLESHLYYFEGKDVKVNGQTAVWHIENGQKKPYLNDQEFLDTGRKWGDVRLIRADILEQIPLIS